MQENERYQKKSRETKKEVEDCLRQKTGNVSELANNQKWSVLGYRHAKEGQYHSRVVLLSRARRNEVSQSEDFGAEGASNIREGETNAFCEDFSGGKAKTVSVWTTEGLEKILDKCEKCFEAEVDDYKRKTFWLPQIGRQEQEGLEIEIEPPRCFLTSEGKAIAWSPIRVVCSPDPKKLEELRAIALRFENEECEKDTTDAKKEPLPSLCESPAPKNNDTKKALYLQPGEYICQRYARTNFRNRKRTILFLLPIGEDLEPTTDEEIPTYGYFLEKELEALGNFEEVLQKREKPFHCRIGKVKTTPQKKKDRLVALAL